MNLHDISVHCETLGIRFDAPVIAIGAIAFDRTTGKLGQKFYREVEINSAVRSGTPEGSTIAWWITQSPRAKSIFGRNADQASLATVLMDFTTWCRSAGAGVPRIWAKGPAEDVTWLNHAFAVGGHGISAPWHHSNVRDVHTIQELAFEVTGFDHHTVQMVGEAHNAVDDAIQQANVISACYKALSNRRVAPAERVDPVDDEL